MDTTKRRGRLSKEERVAIYEARLSGKSPKIIAESMGIHPSTVYRALTGDSGVLLYRDYQQRLNRMKPLDGKLNVTQVQAILNLYFKEGTDVYEISNRYKVSTVMIYNIVKGLSWRRVYNKYKAERGALLL